MCIGRHSSSSFTRCSTRCDITSKKLGGMCISNIDIVTATSSLRLGMSLGSMTLAQNLRKMRDNLMIAIRGSCCNKPLMHCGNNYCIMTCQSCVFIPLNFLVVTCLAIAPQYPVRTWITANLDLNIWNFVSFIMYSATDFMTLVLLRISVVLTNQSSSHTHVLSMSRLYAMVSFFPSIVLITYLHTFSLHA